MTLIMKPVIALAIGLLSIQFTCSSPVEPTSGRKLIGESCYFNWECTASVPDTYCIWIFPPGLCACKNNPYPISNRTCQFSAPRRIGDYCVSDQQCERNVDPDTKCIGLSNGASQDETDFGRCECQSNPDPIYGTTCDTGVPLELGAPCVVREQCTTNIAWNTVCHSESKTCQCDVMWHPVNSTTCELDLPQKIGEFCRFSEECKTNVDQNSYCHMYVVDDPYREGLCRCEFGWIPSEDNENCIAE